MLRFSPKFSPLLLVCTLITGSGLMASALSMPGAAAAGCHGHPHSTPNPQPVSYQCCAVGHSPALQPDVYRSVVFLPVKTVSATSLLLPAFEPPAILIHDVAEDPPVRTPLRI